MLHERVAEALHDVIGKLHQFLFREVQGGQELVVHHLLHELANLRIFAALLHGVQAAQVANGAQHGMRAVQEGHLSLVVRSLGRDEEHVQAGFVGGELGGNLLGSLDHPQVENLGLVQQMVVVTGTLAQLGGGVARITRDDTVYQGAVHAAGAFEPGAEFRTQVPQLDVLADALFQVFTVFEDELAGEDDKALVLGALEVLETVIQELGELAGIAAGGFVLQLASRVKGDTGLRGVGNHKADFRLLGQGQVGAKVLVRVQAAGDDVNQVHAIHGLAVLQTLQIQVVQAILLVEPAHHAFLDGLDHHYGTVEVRLLVGLPDNPLDECAEEVSFAKLNHLLGVLFCLRCRRAV